MKCEVKKYESKCERLVGELEQNGAKPNFSNHEEMKDLLWRKQDIVNLQEHQKQVETLLNSISCNEAIIVRQLHDLATPRERDNIELSEVKKGRKTHLFKNMFEFLRFGKKDDLGKAKMKQAAKQKICKGMRRGNAANVTTLENRTNFFDMENVVDFIKLLFRPKKEEHTKRGKNNKANNSDYLKRKEKEKIE